MNRSLLWEEEDNHATIQTISSKYKLQLEKTKPKVNSLAIVIVFLSLLIIGFLLLSIIVILIGVFLIEFRPPLFSTLPSNQFSIYQEFLGTSSVTKPDGSFYSFSRMVLFNNSTGEKIAVILEKGGLLHELILKQNDCHCLYSVLESDLDVNNLAKDWYWNRGDVLSPFVNNIFNGTYFFEGNRYQLPITNTELQVSSHGFLRWQSLQLIRQEITSSRASFTLGTTITPNSIPPLYKSGYPFSLSVEFTYSLDSVNGFTLHTKVKNIQTVGNIPYCQGFHPYFSFFNGRIDNLYLSIPSQFYMETNSSAESKEKWIPTGNKIPFHENTLSLQNRNLDTTFVVDSTASSSSTIAETHLWSPLRRAKIIVWQEKEKYPYLQIFTTWYSVAIEPMTCIPNAFNNKIGLLVLKPQEEWEARFGIKVEYYKQS